MGWMFCCCGIPAWSQPTGIIISWPFYCHWARMQGKTKLSRQHFVSTQNVVFKKFPCLAQVCSSTSHYKIVLVTPANVFFGPQSLLRMLEKNAMFKISQMLIPWKSVNLVRANSHFKVSIAAHIYLWMIQVYLFPHWLHLLFVFAPFTI